MFRFSFIHRWPKQPLLGLAVLAVALVAAGGGVTRKAEAATGVYTIEVSFESLTFTDIADGLGNNDAELYGTLYVGPYYHAAGEGTRMLGTVNNPGVCGASWAAGNGACYKTIGEKLAFFFAQTPLCEAGVSSSDCLQPYFFANNTLRFTTFSVDPTRTDAQVELTIAVKLWDYDRTSANDPMCRVRANVGFTGPEIPSLDKTLTFHNNPAYDDGDCAVRVRFRRV
jgi:hypothetical protein